MTDVYDGNGDYATYNDDDDYGKQRKGGCVPGVDPHNGDSSNHDLHHHVGGVVGSGGGGGVVGGGMGMMGGGGEGGQLNDKANEYIRDCMAEKNRMDRKFPIAEKLMDCEIEKVQSMGRIPPREQKYADIYREKPLRVSQKVLVPIREHPKFNFVGKLLGPKGNSLRRLQEETLCKMTVLGRNSMRDRAKEEELRSSKDPKYAHLNSDLHVEISTIAPPAEAYARIAYAMAELRKYLIPDSNDVIRQEQLRELMDNTGISDDVTKSAYKKIPHQPPGSNLAGGGVGSAGGGCGTAGVLGGAGGTMGAGAGGTNMSMGKGAPHHAYRTPQSTQNLQFNKNTVAPKQKVLSILEKARTAMEETYGRGYEDPISYEQPSYDAYPYGHGPNTHAHTGHVPSNTGIGTANMAPRGPYDVTDYETDYNRRDYYPNSSNFGGGGASTMHSNHNTGINPNHNRSHVNR
ncbi:PREDICTED: KH domain-containing, RNA-binding, signal transduction-associated protein 2 [Bactrocera latifrons]|uniref:KH domain-containing, RNA-binding, signal transduction-associated protein 2 n=1 Tax=Bactrocera latifrons TaxID=174628 RepID=A0A0K8U9B6_BACLA|nr:PREDICTED: KH domain-containing, RNA-binding, signal transduction-associated protein 2 [Bactrocera latifrons]XP_018785933.1 PREDICTED: KH domain-containing, RNA-binding, signal transduction-associated protein 2 [Bactrocera latifrons]XP_018785934.1 PREDICTED: KH domain-containing, RNA-binding, signal transduction-associated protein 2 [Bactrocera latifrons]